MSEAMYNYIHKIIALDELIKTFFFFLILRPRRFNPFEIGPFYFLIKLIDIIP